MFVVKFNTIAGLIFICICDVVLGRPSVTGNRSGYRLPGNATGTAGLESMLNVLNGTTYHSSKSASIGNLSSFTGSSRTQNVSANNNKTLNITHNLESSIFNNNNISNDQTFNGLNVLNPSNNSTSSYPNTNDTLASNIRLNTKSYTSPLNGSSTGENITSTLVPMLSNTSLSDSTKTCCGVGKSAINAFNGTISDNSLNLNRSNKSASEATYFLNSSATTVSNKTYHTENTVEKAGSALNATNTLYRNNTGNANNVDAFVKYLINVTDHSNNYSTNGSKLSRVASKSILDSDFNGNRTTVSGSIHNLNASIMNPFDVTNHSNIAIPNAYKVSTGGNNGTEYVNITNGTFSLNNVTLLSNEKSNAGTRSILNAFLIQAMNEKEVSPITNNISKTTNAGTRRDFFVSNGIGYFNNSVNGINYENNKSLSLQNDTTNVSVAGVPPVIGIKHYLDLSNRPIETNSTTSMLNFSSSTGINNSSSIPLNITGYSNTSTFVKENTRIIDTNKYLKASYDDNSLNNSNADAMGNIITLINNLTDSNWTANPLTSSDETVSSIAKLINSLNGLNWTEHSNTSSDDNITAVNSTASNLLSAADLNDTLLDHSTNAGNINDTLVLRLRDYFQAMNLTADPNPWGISINDTLRERIMTYLEALNRTNYTNKTIAKTKTLLENAKKFPTISNLLEKGKSYVEKNLGVTIDDKQVANLVSHFINWRDQSQSHSCLTDILDVKQVNECFAKLAGCTDDNSTARNVISHLRNFFTCRDKKKSRNSILVGNYTIKSERGQLKANETPQEKEKKTNEKPLHKSEASSRDGTTSHGKHLEKWMFDEPDCDDSINALEKCQFEKTKEANTSVKDMKGSSTRSNKTLTVASDCDEPSNVLGRCKLHGKYQPRRRNKTADCEGSSTESCKFKMSLSKFMKDTCDNFEDSYKKCKSQKGKKLPLRSNGTCDDEIKALEKCRTKIKEANKVYEEDCDGSANPKARCFVLNHLSSTTFSGNIEKADIVKGMKTIDGALNETILNETSDFQSGNDSFTMKNLTTFQECEGCLKHNKTGEENLLNFNTEKDSSKSNTTDDKNALGEFLKKFEIKKMSSKCYQPSIFEMWKSQDDDDKNTAKEECFGISKRRLITKHVTNRNKETSSDGTITKDKTTEGTKVTDDDGKEVKQDKEASETNAYNADHAKILQDILSGKHEEDNDKATPEKPIETDENRTIPIDQSILRQKEHDLQNPDADVGIVGIDANPAIETIGTQGNATKGNGNNNNSNNINTEDDNKEDNENEKNDDDSKPKEGETYWLGDDSDKNNTNANKTSDEDNIKRILCFGDSITKGYYMRGRKYHPYSIKLESLLREDNLKVEVINHGINGECVSLEMQRRLATDLEELPKLDLVIILGGTNDLLNLDCVRKLDLFQEIKNLHILVRVKGYKSVVVTIPEAKVNHDGTDTMTIIEYRKELDDTNQKLRMYAVASKLPIIDLADDFTRHTLPGKTNVSSLWDDSIHPSREGYDRIGEIIYGQVKGLL